MSGAAIAGASGLTGHYVLNRLLDDARFDPVVAILRKPLHRSHPRLLERVADFEHLAKLPPIALSTAFCCLGTTIRKAGSRDAFRLVDHAYALHFARWARANGARHFLLVSSVGASSDSSNFYLRVKGELERDLATLGFESLDLFQPSFLLGTRTEPRLAERLGQTIIQALEFTLTGPLERYRGIPASTVADAMVARANAPTSPGVRRYEWRAITAQARLRA